MSNAQKVFCWNTGTKGKKTLQVWNQHGSQVWGPRSTMSQSYVGFQFLGPSDVLHGDSAWLQLAEALNGRSSEELYCDFKVTVRWVMGFLLIQSFIHSFLPSVLPSFIHSFSQSFGHSVNSHIMALIFGHLLTSWLCYCWQTFLPMVGPFWRVTEVSIQGKCSQTVLGAVRWLGAWMSWGS